MSCTCKRRFGLLDYLAPNKILNALVLHSYKSTSGHNFSFVLTNPRNLDYHYNRWSCYCQDEDKTPATYDHCFAKFLNNDEEFKRQIRDFTGMLFVSDGRSYRALKRGNYSFRIIFCDDPTLAPYNKPCYGLSCSNPLECSQTGGLMHLLIMDRYEIEIELAIAEQTRIDLVVGNYFAQSDYTSDSSGSDDTYSTDEFSEIEESSSQSETDEGIFSAMSSESEGIEHEE